MTDQDKDIKDQIDVAAFFLAQKMMPYDVLCWMYADRKIFADHNEIASDDELRCKSAEIYFSSCEYDVLCYLIAELDIKNGTKFKKAKRIV